MLDSVPAAPGETGADARAGSPHAVPGGGRGADPSRLPARLPSPDLVRAPANVSKTWTFDLGGERARHHQRGTFWSVNGHAFDPERVDHRPRLGTVERWRLRNTSDMTHYVHIHAEQWRTVLRDGKPPPPWERGLEDTWRLEPGEVVEVAARFEDYTGPFMIHCHMLDHEDHGMMARFDVGEVAVRSARGAGSARAATWSRAARSAARGVTRHGSRPGSPRARPAPCAASATGPREHRDLGASEQRAERAVEVALRAASSRAWWKAWSATMIACSSSARIGVAVVGDRGAQHATRSVVSPVGRQRRRQALEHAADGEDVGQVRRVHAGDPGATMDLLLGESLDHEPLHGLADRAAGELQLRREQRDTQAVAGHHDRARMRPRSTSYT